MANLDSILKSRDITLPAKVHIFKAMVFLVVMYEGEIWTIKKAEPWRIDAFELWCWRRLLRVPWTAKRLSQSVLTVILFIGRTDVEAEAPILWLPDEKYWLTGNLMLGKIEGRRKRRWQDEMFGWHHQLDGHDFVQTPGFGEGQGGLACCGSWGCK